jgi:hypothetical protein
MVLKVTTIQIEARGKIRTSTANLGLSIDGDQRWYYMSHKVKVSDIHSHGQPQGPDRYQSRGHHLPHSIDGSLIRA